MIFLESAASQGFEEPYPSQLTDEDDLFRLVAKVGTRSSKEAHLYKKSS